MYFVPKYGISHVPQLDPEALLHLEAGEVGPDVHGDHEQGMGGAIEGKKGGCNPSGGDGKISPPPGANTENIGAIKDGLVSIRWSVNDDTNSPLLPRRPHVAMPAIFVLESGVGNYPILIQTLLSVEWANIVVLHLAQLVMLVLGQLLDGLVRQILQ